MSGTLGGINCKGLSCSFVLDGVFSISVKAAESCFSPDRQTTVNVALSAAFFWLLHGLLICLHLSLRR